MKSFQVTFDAYADLIANGEINVLSNKVKQQLLIRAKS